MLKTPKPTDISNNDEIIESDIYSYNMNSFVYLDQGIRKYAVKKIFKLIKTSQDKMVHDLKNQKLPSYMQPIIWDNDNNYNPEGNYAETIHMDSIQIEYLENLFRKNNSDHIKYNESGKENINNLSDRLQFFSNGLYKIDDPDKPGHKISVNIPMVDIGNGITIPVSPLFGKPFDLTDKNKLETIQDLDTYLDRHSDKFTRTLGHWGVNPAVDAEIRSNMIITENDADVHHIVELGIQRPDKDKTMNNQASFAFHGGMLESAKGFFAILKECIEEGYLFPHMILPKDNLPKLLTLNEISNKTDHELTQYESKKKTTEEIYCELVLDNSIVTLANLPSSKLNKYIQLGKYDQVAKLLPIGTTEKDVEEVLQYAFAYQNKNSSFNFQIMEYDKRNTFLAFMASTGYKFELDSCKLEELKRKKVITNRENQGMACISLNDLKALCEEKKSNYNGIDCDNNPTHQVRNYFTDDKIVPIWRTHLDVLVEIAKTNPHPK